VEGHEVQVQSHNSQYGICGGKRDDGTSFYLSPLVLPYQYNSTNVPCSFIHPSLMLYYLCSWVSLNNTSSTWQYTTFSIWSGMLPLTQCTYIPTMPCVGSVEVLLSCNLLTITHVNDHAHNSCTILLNFPHNLHNDVHVEFTWEILFIFRTYVSWNR
jgi:hypothetical protein